MKINLLKSFRQLEREFTMGELIDAARNGHTDRWGRNEPIGAWLWRTAHSRNRIADICGTWQGWPTCECSGCGCEDPAVTTDDGGNPVCEGCEDYTLDDDNCVVCAKDPRAEIICESCGAGNQVRTYVVLKDLK